MTNARSTVWDQKVAERMVRDRLSFRHACNEAQIDLAGDDALRIERSKAFREAYQVEFYRFYDEMVHDPRRTKDSTIGEMLAATRELMRAGQFDKALEGFFKICRVEGWVGGETNTVVFGNVSQKEIEAMREKIRETTAVITVQ